VQGMFLQQVLVILPQVIDSLLEGSSSLFAVDTILIAAKPARKPLRVHEHASSLLVALMVSK